VDLNDYLDLLEVPGGEARCVAKNERTKPHLRSGSRQFVEKNHQLRLHIVSPDVELLSLPTRPTGTSETLSKEPGAGNAE
jgi:hypothetical protein